MDALNPGEKARSKLYLIGAGPGDPDLLTMKAVRVLAECDVILYDRLVSEEVLRLTRPGAELVYVGKSEGEQEQVQSRIFGLIEQHARAGKTIGRLKGGDPLVFGRGAEEWAMAHRHGIPVEFVPGVSSAIGVPGLAGIPLTARGVSQGFAVVTAPASASAPEDWERYVEVDTLVILMGVHRRVWIAESLIRAGRSEGEPVAFVERGTTARERVVLGTLGQVAAGGVEVRSPAVFVVGKVVRLREQLVTSHRVPTRPRSAD